MKKPFILGLLLYVYAAAGFAQQRLDDYIDEAVSKAAGYLEARLPSSANIAIVNDSSDELAETISYKLEINLVNGRKKNHVLARNKEILKLIEDELDFQYSGEVSDDSLVALGHKLGAQYLVLISVKPQGGSKYLFRIKAVSVETAEIIASAEYPFQRQINILSKVIGNYMLKQATYDEISSSIQSGDVYIKLGFRVHSEINIENLPEELIDAAPSSYGQRKNICFVIDISGSMSGYIGEAIKINWVKREMEQYFKKNIGTNDVISAVVFNDTFDEIIISKCIKNNDDIEWCIRQIKEKLVSSGNTMIAPGLRRGYELVKVNKKEDYSNCVILFTDGESNDKEDVKNIVRENKNQDIATISTVALSTDDAKKFMTEVATLGGGLSLFVDSRNAARSMEKEMAMLVNATAPMLKDKVHRLDITLAAGDEVIFKDASEECTSWNNDFAHYTIDIREDEYTAIGITASLGQNAIQTGSILGIEITGNTLLTTKHQISLKPPDVVTSEDKTKILTIFRTSL